MSATQSFITGSYAYGIPRPESDLDVVMLVMDDPTLIALQALADSADGSGGDSLRFGKLNLIIVASEAEWAQWRTGTQELIKRRPVTRADAVAYLEAKKARIMKADKEVF